MTAGDQLTLRRTERKDMLQYFFWANDPVTRQNAFDPYPISWENHVTWFEQKLHSLQTQMWVMVTSCGLPVGQIRFDIQIGIADIDYSLDPLVRGRGWGKILLELGISAFKKKHPDLLVRGRVKPGNIASIRTFQQFGFDKEVRQDVVIFIHTDHEKTGDNTK